MADKIRNFFAKKKVEKQFKKAGPGHKLSEESASSKSGGQVRTYDIIIVLTRILILHIIFPLLCAFYGIHFEMLFD